MKRPHWEPDDSGTSAVEYGLLVSAVAAVIVIAMFALGGPVQGMFQQTCATVGDHVSSPNNC
jgi:pilus assembly protein Flp/PilA